MTESIVGYETSQSIPYTWSTQSPKIGALIAALSKAQGMMEGASKSSENPFFKSKYADLYECLQAARKPLLDNELAVFQTTEMDGNRIVIITTLGHSSGEWVRGRITMQPKKNDDQALGSSITYGRRYTFAAIVGLGQKDDDANASVEPKKESRPHNTKNVPPRKPRPDLVPELNEATDIDSLAKIWKAIQADLKRLPKAEQDKLLALKNSLKLKLSRPADTVNCPAGNGDVPVQFCSDECKNREGCPAHD